MSTGTQGHDRRLCGAHKRQGDGTCGRPAGWGTSHVGEGACKLHGGSTRTSSKGAALRQVERDARELFGVAAPERGPVHNPLAAYAELAARVLSWLDLMDTLLNELTRVGYAHDRNGEQVEATVQVFERAMDRANTVLASYARLRIDDRLAEITEKQKTTVIRAIETALEEVGIPEEDRDDARRRVGRQLRLITGGLGA